MRLIGQGWLLVLAFVLTGCAAPTTQRVAVSADRTNVEALKQQDLVAEQLVEERARMFRVYWRLATRNVPLCPVTSRLVGYDAMTAGKGDLGDALRRVRGVGDEPTVVSVVPGGAAEAAGLKPRDVVVTVFGVPATDAKTIRERLRSTDAQWSTVPVQVRRDGKLIPLTLAPVLGCDYPPSLMPARELNAYADGERIFITRGMIAFATSDDELALVMAHEIGHNTMRHIDAKKANAAAGMLGDLALAILSRGAYSSSSISQAAAQSHSQEFEAEADYVGLYMLANSGYSIADAPKFWRRMAVASPANIRGSHGASHPSTAYRMVALEEAAKEVEGKRTSGLALLPQRKDGKAFVAGEALLPGQSAPARQEALR